jgi:hypothetical protein
MIDEGMGLGDEGVLAVGPQVRAVLLELIVRVVLA